MHKLARSVRFSINPFLDTDIAGANSFASKPAGEGLAIFLELTVEVVGGVEGSTGFVVNVLDIDKIVRGSVAPIFAGRIRECFRGGKGVDFCGIAELLRKSRAKLDGKFAPAKVGEVSLKLNPFREMAIDCEDSEMIYFSEKFEFAAMHKLWNDDFTEEKNFEVFGKCANPAGHGHNYIAQVTLKSDKAGDFCVGDFERTVDDELIKLLDHKNLNADVAELGQINPTVENIAVFAWERLKGKFKNAQLHCVAIWESERTFCSYYG